MLTYNFEHVDKPLYEYIYDCIKNDILAGKLKSGEKLPSKRSFAQNNGISTITIQNAYDQLISEGYIFTRPKKGYYVADVPMTARSPKDASITLDIKLPPKQEDYAIDLSNNRTNPDNFPFSIWARLMRDTISGRSDELMIPSPTGGTRELRSAIAEHLKSFRGMLVDPNQIVIGAGTEYLYGLLIQLLGYDKVYCIENPGYKKLVQIYAQYKIACRFAGMDECGIKVSALEQTDAQIAHISPTHHFPTGTTMPITRRYEVLAWANEKDERYIIEDDYDSEFRQNGKPIPPLQSIDACEKVIYMNTFSKSLTPTIRISYMVLPVHLANRFYEQLSFYACTVSNFEQYTLAEFICQGYFEKHINRMRLYYGRQRRQILDCINTSKLHNFCQVIENDSGLHFILELKTSLTDREITAGLRDNGIHMEALSDYYFTGEHTDRHRFLINYSDVNLPKLQSALDVLADIVQQKTTSSST